MALRRPEVARLRAPSSSSKSSRPPPCAAFNKPPLSFVGEDTVYGFGSALGRSSVVVRPSSPLPLPESVVPNEAYLVRHYETLRYAVFSQVAEVLEPCF